MAAASVAAVAQDLPAADAKERELMAVLQSDAPKGEKAITCKRLAVYGSERCVAVVAPLLADEELASWARIALEAIPGAAADAALRDAADKLQGRLLVGVINSIAVRRDRQAVDVLVRKLNDTDSSVASSAAVALGQVGGQPSAKALTPSLATAPAGVRSAVAEGCILCAERFLAQGETADAVALYDAVRRADVPNQRRLEAVRGAILARGSAGLPLLVEQLRSEDEEHLGIGLRTARELPGLDVTKALAAELAGLRSNRQPLLLLALADRDDSAVLPVVLKAAREGRKDLRITAINILPHLGDISCVPVLLEAATEDDAQIEQAATETLVRLAGKDVDADLAGRLSPSRGKLRRVLIDLAGQRQISQALPEVASSLNDADAGIRGSAVKTVAIIGGHEQAPDLVKLLLATRIASERTEIGKTLLTICGVHGSACLPHVRPLIQGRDPELHILGLRALAVIGGSEALTAVKSAMESAAPAVQDEAVRILSGWPNKWPNDSEAGKALLALAVSAENMPQHVLGLRGYLQYIRGNKQLSNDEKAAEVKDLLTHIKRLEEKRQVIAVLGETPSVLAFDLLTTLAEDSALVEEAYSAIVQIAAQDIQGLSKEQRRQALQTVVDKSGNDGTKQRARKALAGIP